MLNNNWLALLITFIIALAWIRFMDLAAQRGWVNNRLSRKIIHIGTGPIFVMCWVLFRDTPEARYLAALVPGAFTLQFLLVGLGIIKDEASVQSMTRNGDRREILRGPLFYGIIFVVMTILFWIESPVGIVALMMLCGGDGLADIIGRRYGRMKLFWSQDKSWIGSAGMFIGGWVLSLAILYYFLAFQVFPGPLAGYVWPVTIIALGSTLVESLPFHDVDNITIALAAMLLGQLVL